MSDAGGARTSRLDDPSFTRKLVLILIPLILIVIAGIAVTAYFYQLEPESKLCENNKCLRSAENLRISGNFSADPCEDFYEFACGRWDREHFDRGWFPAYTIFTTMAERVLIETDKFLNSMGSDKDAKAVKQARNLYQSCMDVELMDTIGPTTIFKILRDLGLPKVPHYFTKAKKFSFDWLLAEARTKKILHDSVIGLRVAPHPKDKARSILRMGIPLRKSPLLNAAFISVPKDELKTDSPAAREIIEDVLKSLLVTAAGQAISDQHIKAASKIIFKNMNEIYALVANYSTRSVNVTTYVVEKYQSRLSAGLKQAGKREYPDLVEKLLKELFSGLDTSVNMKSDLIGVSEKDDKYLVEIIGFIMGLSDVHKELVKWFSTVSSLITYADSKIANKILELSMTDKKTRVPKPRSLYCSQIVSDNMGYAIAFALDNETFPEIKRDEIREMVGNIKHVFKHQIERSSWLDSETKVLVNEKSEKLVAFLGHPRWLNSSEALDKHYKDLDIKKNTFLDNLVSCSKRLTPFNLNQLNKEFRKDMNVNPMDVNSWHILPENSIIVPMGLTQYPIFNLGLDVLNYGALGSVLAHEFSHGFEADGLQYDEDGDLAEGLKNLSFTYHYQKLKCYERQYAESVVPVIGKKVDSKRTLVENLADNGGVYLAFRAYLKHLEEYGRELKLPGFESYSQHQLFFIAFGSIWCDHSSASQMKEAYEHYKYAPNVVRCNEALQNSPGFAEAFKCPNGSRMNPSVKCQMW